MPRVPRVPRVARAVCPTCPRLNGTPVRLRFVLKDADLFSIRFGDS